MKTLLLLRHARAAAAPAQPDAARPLEERGTADARALGLEIARRRLTIDHVVCSPAVRARQTATAVLAAAALAPPVRLDARIYDASASTLLQVVRELPDAAATALLVGHNPGLEEVVFRVQPFLVRGMPPCTLVALDLPVARWTDAPGEDPSSPWTWGPDRS